MDLSNMLNGSNPNYSNNKVRKESNFSTLNHNGINSANSSRSNSINQDKAVSDAIREKHKKLQNSDSFSSRCMN